MTWLGILLLISTTIFSPKFMVPTSSLRTNSHGLHWFVLHGSGGMRYYVQFSKIKTIHNFSPHCHILCLFLRTMFLPQYGDMWNSNKVLALSILTHCTLIYAGIIILSFLYRSQFVVSISVCHIDLSLSYRSQFVVSISVCRIDLSLSYWSQFVVSISVYCIHLSSLSTGWWGFGIIGQGSGFGSIDVL